MKKERLQGIVMDTHPDLRFKVKMDSGKEIFAYLAGKMRLHKIKILCGDKVLVELDDYGEKGRIVYRLS